MKPLGKGALAAAATATSVAAFALGAAVGRRRNIFVGGRHADGYISRTVAAFSVDGLPEGECDALTCAICLSELVLPRVATCGHTFCTTCLNEMFDSSERRCPTCRRHMKARTANDLPHNYTARAVLECRARNAGPEALERFHAAEDAARACTTNSSEGDADGEGEGSFLLGPAVSRSLRQSWKWVKWTAIIMTEFGAFIVSLKEVLDAPPSRPRRFEALV